MSANDPQDKHKPKPLLGSEAFGHDADGRPTGADAFGGFEPKLPLKGALLFGNDPSGKPTGAEAFGGNDPDAPLKGALLFGNDPKGNPTGADAFGGSEESAPLKGALLFGNDPKGASTGAEAFGGSDPTLSYRGAEAFGAPQLVPERLAKDEIGYDFVGVLLRAEDSGIAGIRKDPRDRVRDRVLKLLGRRLACEGARLRHGLSEDSLPWGRLKRDRDLDRQLAEALRRLYEKAPGEVLGIGHVRDLLESTERMHSFELACEWDTTPMQLAVLWRGRRVAYAASALHKEHSFLIFKSSADELLAYVDTLVPRLGEQTARIRGPKGEEIATVALVTPGPADEVSAADPQRLEVVVRDAQGRVAFEVAEERATPSFFLATLSVPTAAEPVGKIEDRLSGGKVRAVIEIDLRIPRIIAWGVAAVLADLSRLRRSGWPEGAVRSKQTSEPAVESIEAALGPRRPRGGPKRT
jgi:hypothetical protein